MITAEQVKELLKNKALKEHPDQQLHYALIMDSLRNVFNPYLASKDRASKEQDLEWLLSKEYGRKVDRLGGCSFEACCLALDISCETLRKVVNDLLKSKELRNKYLTNLYSNLYLYNNIYYNIYNNR
jgi:hypothetical protein